MRVEAALLGVVGIAGGCLDINEKFVEGTTSSVGTTGTTAMEVSSTSETASPPGDESSSSSGSVVIDCDADPYEDNNDPASAAVQPGLAFSDGPVTIDAGRPAGDVDWYEVPLVDDAVSAAITVEADADLRLCVFAECADGVTMFDVCHFDGVETNSPEGWPGCCRASRVGLGYWCSGAGSFSGRMRISVTETDTTPMSCVPYELRYDA